MQAITFSARAPVRNLGDVVRLLPASARDLPWYADVSAEFVSLPGVEADVAEAQRSADEGRPIPSETFERLVATNVQMIDGRLTAGEGSGQFVLASIRGDEWDLGAADATVLAEIRTLVGATDLPGGTSAL